MAFAVATRERTTLGRLMAEVVRFTELATDTGGSFTTSVSSPEYALVSQDGGASAFAMRVSLSGQTVTVAHAAGPTSGAVLVIGKV